MVGTCLKVTGVLAVVLAVTAQFFGVFLPVVWQEGPIEELKILYLDFTGPYSGVGDTFSRIGSMVCGDDCDERVSAGFYLDNPEVVSQEELRSMVGMIAKSDKEVVTVQKAHPEVKLKIIKPQNALITTFPMVRSLGAPGWLASFYVAVNKVYPALKTYCSENDKKGGAVMEIYDMPNAQFRYFAFKDPIEASTEKAQVKKAKARKQ